MPRPRVDNPKQFLTEEQRLKYASNRQIKLMLLKQSKQYQYISDDIKKKLGRPRVETKEQRYNILKKQLEKIQDAMKQLEE